MEEEKQNLRLQLNVTETKIEELTKEMENAEERNVQILMRVESERDLLHERLSQLHGGIGTCWENQHVHNYNIIIKIV